MWHSQACDKAKRVGCDCAALAPNLPIPTRVEQNPCTVCGSLEPCVHDLPIEDQYDDVRRCDFCDNPAERYDAARNAHTCDDHAPDSEVGRED